MGRDVYCDIFFHDLTPEAKVEVLEACGVETEAELFALTNWDTLPMETLTIPTKD